MLYTFSLANYDRAELDGYFVAMNEQDAVLLWQDGALLPIKYPQYFQRENFHYFALEQDISARNLTALLLKESQVRLISLADLVEITEQYFPQLAL